MQTNTKVGTANLFQWQLGAAQSCVRLVGDSAFMNQNESVKVEEGLTLMDAFFPLQEGSHKDVKCYLVYYNHLLACFEDGRQCGLMHPQQFHDYGGSKDAPVSLLFRDYGVQIDIDLAPCERHRHCAQIDKFSMKGL
ncbi:hypothetical protein [Paraferrimonas sp. SM1919]|uniref:hypothetical protein n=1 Tax=Paraferrimonas sp. SM1919 TaxID=2662263 RepID=UPI0013D77809|nr:hypothetical protein [Paraferrimonas sp. SM1919]